MKIFSLSTPLLALVATASSVSSAAEGTNPIKDPEDPTLTKTAPNVLVDIATTGIFSNLVGIGMKKGNLLPKDYLDLHKEGRLLNFRPLWKDWCKSLNEDTYDQALNDLGDKMFFDIFDGECLMLGPIKWMSQDRISNFSFPPLKDIPFNYDTNIVISQELIAPLIEKTVALGSCDSFGFLSANPTNLKNTLHYLNSLTWDNPSWGVLTLSFFERLDKKALDQLDAVIFKMLPDATQLDAKNISLIFERITAYLVFRQKKLSDLQPSLIPLLRTPLQKLGLALQKVEDLKHLGSSPQIAEIIRYLNKEEFSLTSRKYWAFLNLKTITSEKAQKPIIKAFFEKLELGGEISLELALFPFKGTVSTPIPYPYFKLIYDENYGSKVQKIFAFHSAANVAEFIRWYVRRPPRPSQAQYIPMTLNAKGIISITANDHISFGIMAQIGDKIMCPDSAFFNQLVTSITNNIKGSWWNNKDNMHVIRYIFEIALVYGHPLPTDSELQKYFKALGKDAALTSRFLLDEVNQSLFDAVIRYLCDESSQVKCVSKETQEFLEYSKEQFTNLEDIDVSYWTPRRLSLYLREGLPKPIPPQVTTIRESLFSSTDRMWEITKQGKKSEVLSKLRTLRKVYDTRFYEFLSKVKVEYDDAKVVSPEPASSSFSSEQLVTSGFFYNLKGIGKSDGQLAPELFVHLHKNKQFINFRPLWKEWCKSMKTYEDFQNAFTDVDEFKGIVDGECLIMSGVLQNMSIAEINGLDCQPLKDVPFTKDTEDFVVPSTKILEALIARNFLGFKEKGEQVSDNLGFLAGNPSNLQLVLQYLKTLNWDHEHWDLISPLFLKRAKLDEEKFVKTFQKMLPPNNLTLTNENKELVVRRIVAFVIFGNFTQAKLKAWESKNGFLWIGSYPPLTKWLKEMRSKNILSLISPLDKYLREEKLTESEVNQVCSLIPSEYSALKDEWLRLCEVNLPEKTQTIPEFYLKLLEDMNIERFNVAGSLLTFSTQHQVNFAAWYYRQFPLANVNQTEPLGFGLQTQIESESEADESETDEADSDESETDESETDESLSCPSPKCLAKFCKKFTRFGKSPAGISAFLLALTYGYSLEGLKDKKKVALANLVSSELSLFNFINQTIITFIINENLDNSHVLFNEEHKKLAEDIRLCNKAVNKLSSEELENMTPNQLALYLRKRHPKDAFYVEEVRNDFLRNVNLGPLISKRDAESRKVIFDLLREIYNPDEFLLMIGNMIKFDPANEKVDDKGEPVSDPHDSTESDDPADVGDKKDATSDGDKKDDTSDGDETNTGSTGVKGPETVTADGTITVDDKGADMKLETTATTNTKIDATADSTPNEKSASDVKDGTTDATKTGADNGKVEKMNTSTEETPATREEPPATREEPAPTDSTGERADGSDKEKSDENKKIPQTVVDNPPGSKSVNGDGDDDEEEEGSSTGKYLLVALGVLVVGAVLGVGIYYVTRSDSTKPADQTKA